MAEYGVPQERDWNELTGEEFRQIMRREFERHYPERLRYPDRRLFWEEQKDWYLAMSAKGWIAPGWPVEYGGMGLSPSKLLIFMEEQERWGVARFQDHGIRMVGPILINFGSDEQRARFLPPILSCEHRYCQGYSEPEAGSDLANIQTTAVLSEDGTAFVINGHKIWTSMAHDVTHIFLLARTDTTAVKQAGISFFLAEIDTPGITVRPIRDVAGHEEFCEVFLDSVRVPSGNLIGGLNKGWSVATSLLEFERLHVGTPQLPEYALRVLHEVAEARGLLDDPLFRSRAIALQLDVHHLRDAYAEFAAQLSRGERLGPDVSLLKIWSTEAFQRIAELIVETAGPLGGINGPVELGETRVSPLAVFYRALPSTIYGGTNEIQRNIIAKRVLNLPQ